MLSLPVMISLLGGVLTPEASAPTSTVSASTPTVSAPATEDSSSASGHSRREDRREKVDQRRIEALKRAYRQRTLGQHPFVRPLFITSALPTSHFGLNFGAGAVWDMGQNADASLTESRSYLAGSAAADAGIRFGKWVGIDADFAGVAGVGRNPDVVLDVGAAAAYSWQASALVRVLHRETTALSLRPQIRGFGARGLALRPGLDAITDQVVGPEPIDLSEAARYTTTQSSALGGLLHVSLAQSLTRFVGLQVGVAGGGENQRRRYYDGERQDVRDPYGLFQSGVALTVDTHPIPLALLAEYNFNLAIGTGAQAGQVAVAHDVGGGVFFNALTQTLGVTVAANLAKGRQSLVTALSFRGYF